MDWQPSTLFHELKCITKAGEHVVFCDFSENYSFVCGTKFMYYPHNAEPSVHPLAIYFKISSDIQWLSLKGNISQWMKKIICLYDGSVFQYTTWEQFLNLTLHQKDSRVPAEWPIPMRMAHATVQTEVLKTCNTNHSAMTWADKIIICSSLSIGHILV